MILVEPVENEFSRIDENVGDEFAHGATHDAE